jgi:hypothetical protein
MSAVDTHSAGNMALPFWIYCPLPRCETSPHVGRCSICHILLVQSQLIFIYALKCNLLIRPCSVGIIISDCSKLNNLISDYSQIILGLLLWRLATHV